MAATTLLDCIYATFWKDYKEYVLAEEKFDKLSLDDRFLYFYGILKQKNCLPNVKNVWPKSNTKAMEYKKFGDDAFCRQSDVNAVKWYTKSAAVALAGSAELASIFANRSAALYRLQRYTASLVDINRALLGNYPENQKPKLVDRKQKCVIQLRSAPSEMISSFMSNLAIALDPERGRTTSSATHFDFDVNMADMNYERAFPLPLDNYPNPLPFTRKNLKVKYNPKFGRHIVATGEIKPGETLGMEKPFASVLNQDFRFSHCANCYVRCESLIPCPTCVLLMFCSRKCQQTAYDRYHRVECRIILYVHHFDIKDDIWLAVRMLLIVTKQGQELKTLMTHPIYKNPMNVDPSYIPSNFDTEDYLNVHHLEDHAAEASFEENYTLGFTAALIVHFLKYTDFFYEKKETGTKKASDISTDLSSKESFAGKLLLKFLFVIKHNVFQIKETLRDLRRRVNDDFVNVSIGSSIYIFHSYFNHSCDENGAKCFHKDVIVSRSVQLVSPGEQIFLNYGSNFGDTCRPVRLQYLRDAYKFDCDCQACKLDWPVLSNTNAATLPKLKRNSTKSDSQKVLSGKTRDLRQISAMSYDRTKYVLLCNHMEIYQKSVKKPWKEYWECQEKLKDVYSTGANHYCLQVDGLILFLQ